MPNLPTPKLESWKFTNLARVAAELVHTELCTTIGCLEAALPVTSGAQAVFHNGAFEPKFSQPLSLAKGVTLTSSALALPPQPLDDLDTLPAPQTHTLTVRGKVLLPLHLIHVQSGPPSVGSVHVVLGDNAELTLVEHHVAAPRFACWHHLGLTITLGTNAKLTHSILQTLPPACLLTRRQRLHAEAGSTYAATVFQSGAALSRLESHTHLTSNCTFSLTGLALTRHNQLHDATLLTHHAAESNTTHIRQRNLIEDSGHAVFQGKFYVAQPAQKTNAYMHCHNMLLSDSARASHKPELEIYADDVKCSHGAATGGLDDAQLFYLRARGLTPAQSRGLLLSGYAEEFITEFPESIRPLLLARLTQWLNETPNQPHEDEDFVPIEGEWLKERAAQPHARIEADSEEVHDE